MTHITLPVTRIQVFCLVIPPASLVMVGSGWAAVLSFVRGKSIRKLENSRYCQLLHYSDPPPTNRPILSVVRVHTSAPVGNSLDGSQYLGRYHTSCYKLETLFITTLCMM